MKLTLAERRRWMNHAGPRLDPFCDSPIEQIELDDYGRLSVSSTIACGVYVVINADDDVMYVGKVCRVYGTVDNRFRYHHAMAEEWDRVWVLPLREDEDPSALEDAMIRYFQPPDNRAGRNVR
jgi:hypothetical protein